MSQLKLNGGNVLRRTAIRYCLHGPLGWKLNYLIIKHHHDVEMSSHIPVHAFMMAKTNLQYAPEKLGCVTYHR